MMARQKKSAGAPVKVSRAFELMTRTPEYHEPAHGTKETDVGGNRCGHVRGAPRTLASCAALPFLAELQRRASSALNHDRDVWLWAGRRRWRQRARGELHDRARPRSERREAIAIVVEYLAHFVQVTNLRVLRFTKGEGVPLDDVAAATSLSIDRVKAAIADLTSCGYLASFQPRAKTDAGYRGRPSVRWFTAKFLHAIGLWRALCRTRERLGLRPPRERPNPRARGFVAQLGRVFGAMRRNTS